MHSSFLDRALEATRKWKKDYNRETASKLATQSSSSSQNANIKAEGFEPLQSHDPLAFAVPMETLMPDTAMDEMTLLGDLKVPNPGFCGLGEARVHYIFSILPELRKVNERNYQGMSTLQYEQLQILIGCSRNTWTRRLVFWL